MTGQPPSRVEVPRDDLPVSCPPRGAKWNMHPRVYLPVPKGEGEVSCPYCGTLYVLVDPQGAPPGEEREDRD